MTSSLDASSWWGGAGRSEDRLTLLDLIRNNTLDLKTAALLWLLVDAKSSIIVASAPQLAGKTTLLSALIDFIPPRYVRVYTRGKDEDFSFVAETEPSDTYFLVPELSDHTPAYLWGDAVITLFDALERGYSVGATIHADTPEEVLGLFEGPPVNVPSGLLHHVHVIVNIRLWHKDDAALRRVNLMTLVTPGPKCVTLVEWDPVTDKFIHSESDEARAGLREHLRLTESDPPLASRTDALSSWLGKGRRSAEDVRTAVTEYYGP